MSQAWRILAVIVAIAVIVFVVIVAAIAVRLLVLGLMVLLILGAIACWATYSYFQYRYMRQEEVLQVLTNAVESGTPLNAALWAYVDDRPQSRWHEFLVAIILTPCYYWAWHRWNAFDYKVEHVAGLLDQGASLQEALMDTPGVATRETVLAAAVGQSTGKLGHCLKSVPRWRIATVWLEMLPRLLYPLLLLIFIAVITTFVLIFIVPKFEKIFADLKVRMPWATEEFIGFARGYLGKGWFILSMILITLLLGIGLIFSSRIRWYCPVLGRIYRLQARSRVLKSLGLLLETGHTLPEALNVLEESGYFSGTVQRRLRLLRFRVALGEPFPEQLQRCGLAPGAMVPLLQAAQRAQNLPWALGELGESLSRRTERLSQRLGMTVFPAAVMMVGLFVGFFAVAVFSPLVALLSEIPS